jgi:hypothetical protein
MTTYLTPDLSLDDDRVPAADLWFFRRVVRRTLYHLVRREFERLEQAGLLNKKKLARRLGKKNASVITRWLGAPSNWTVDTFSDLMVGMGIDPRTPLKGEDQSLHAGVTASAVVRDVLRETLVHLAQESAANSFRIPQTSVSMMPQDYARTTL